MSVVGPSSASPVVLQAQYPELTDLGATPPPPEMIASVGAKKLGIDDPKRIQDIAIVGNLALIALKKRESENYSEEYSDELIAVDVSDPTNMKRAWSIYFGADVNSIAVNAAGTFAMLATSLDDSEFVIVDLTKTKDPKADPQTDYVATAYDLPGSEDGVYVYFPEFPFDFYLSVNTQSSSKLSPSTSHLHNLLRSGTKVALVPPVLAADSAGRSWKPKIDFKDKGYDPVGEIMGRARSASHPEYTFLAVRSYRNALQVVTHLNDELAVEDVNGDGQRIVACIGDSNTVPMLQRNPGSWAHYLQQHTWAPDFKILSFAQIGARMITDNKDTEDADIQLQRALQAEADLVILSLGANDITFSDASMEQVVNEAERFVEGIKGSGKRYLITTLVPRGVDLSNPQDPSYATRKEKTERLNNLIREKFQGHVVDFEKELTLSDLASDGVHIDRTGAIKLGKLMQARLIRPRE